MDGVRQFLADRSEEIFSLCGDRTAENDRIGLEDPLKTLEADGNIFRIFINYGCAYGAAFFFCVECAASGGILCGEFCQQTVGICGNSSFGDTNQRGNGSVPPDAPK